MSNQNPFLHENPSTGADSNRTEPLTSSEVDNEPRRRYWIGLILVGFVVVVASVAAVVFIWKNGSPAEATEAEELNFAEVVISDLIQEVTFDGTLGSIEDDPVTTQLGGTVTEIPASGDTISQGEVIFAIDDQPVVLLYGDLPAFRDIAIGEDTVTVLSQLNGTITWVAEPGTVVEQGDVLYRVDDQPVVALYGDQPAYRDIAFIAIGDEIIDESVTVSSQLNGTITWVAEPGTIIQPGDVLFRVDDQPVIMLYGDQPAYRALYGGYQVDIEGELIDVFLRGYDVLQLEESLVALGYEAAVSVDDTFTFATMLMVKEWQEDVGAEVDGVVDFGEVVFLPGSVQVLDILAAPGDPAGGAVMSVIIGNPTAGSDVLQLQEALITLGHDADGALVANGIFTPETTQAVIAFQAAAGLETDGIVDFGEILFLHGPAQVLDVLAAPGDPAGGGVVSIATGDPTSGIDILQLEEALAALGYEAGDAFIADGIYTLETTQSILAFQAATGLEQDGIIDLGEVIFLPGEVRITNQLATKGSSISEGTPVLGISLSEKVVYMNLPADDQGVLTVGDAVTVEMPDNTLVPATVIYVSQTATPSEYGPATFEVRIKLDDPTVAVGLDEAPVDVIIVSDSVEDVMAIPVSALVALLEGGYAVEVDTGGGQVELIAVEVGFFSTDNMIEITSGTLEPGDQVVVP
jgi:peptidoglycan hydrolase-like protein with peptidoglycan-binding domain